MHLKYIDKNISHYYNSPLIKLYTPLLYNVCVPILDEQ